MPPVVVNQVEGQLIDIAQREIYPARISIQNGKILGIQKLAEAPKRYLLPGFIDAHIHIESSLLPPASFARLALLHGTIATVSDPHEIANVCGIDGVNYMLENAATVPFHFFFGAPSCVPATRFETSGAMLSAKEVAALLARKDIWYLSEVMNFPGVIQGDDSLLQIIASAKENGKPVDGHAPALRGNPLMKYIAAGITTDHECTTLEEANEKLQAGMQILIREGSAAKNYDALHPLLKQHAHHLMFCSDDKHPDELLLGHINKLVAKSIALGYDLFDVLQVACLNPIAHYQLPIGQLRVGDAADFIVVKNIETWEVEETYVKGECVMQNQHVSWDFQEPAHINNFSANQISNVEIAIPFKEKQAEVRVIVAVDGALLTQQQTSILSSVDGFLKGDLEQDILKIVVYNRYLQNSKPAIGFINGFGFKQGAIATSVAHDSHNIIAVGVDDQSIAQAINAVVKACGGLACINNGNEVFLLPLPIAGLMSDAEPTQVATDYTAIDQKAKELGSTLAAPFMTLSFMALLVIPSLKMSDKGLFDGDTFSFSSLFT